MLVYHFGSREGLMREILAGLREREDDRIRAWFRSSKKTRTLPEFLRWHWRRLSTPRPRPAARLIFQLCALALRDPQGLECSQTYSSTGGILGPWPVLDGTSRLPRRRCSLPPLGVCS